MAAPRVYSLTKIVEISHFNMSRIRLAASTGRPTSSVPPAQMHPLTG